MTEPVPERSGRTRLLYVSPLRALAVDVEKNLRAPLRRHRPGRRAPRARRPRADRRHPHRRHLGRRAPPARPPPARPPHHHARVALPDAHVAGPGDAARRRGGDRRRDPRRGRHQARRPPVAHPRAARARSSTRAGGPAAAHRAVGHPAAARGDRPLPRRLRRRRRPPRPVTIVDAGVRKALESRSSSRSRTWASWARSSRSRSAGPAAAGPVRRSIWPSMHPRLLELVEEHRSTLIFVNARRLAERLATRLNELRARGREPGGRAGGPARRPPTPHRAGEGPPRLAVAGAAAADRGRAQVGPAQGPGRHVAASSSASTWARSTSSCRSSRPARSPPGCSASAGPATRSASRAGASSSRSTAADLRRGGGRRRAHARGPHRAHPLPAQPARRPGPADRRHVRARRVDGRRARRPRPPGGQLRRADRRGARAPCSTCSPGATRPRSSPSCGPASCGTGSTACIRGRGRRPAAGRHQRRHHPRPRPVRRVPARRHPGRRARRGDGLREPAGRDVPARRVHVAHRGHHLRPGRSSRPRPGQPGQDAVLARRRPGPPARAGPGGRRVRARGPRHGRAATAVGRLRDEHGLDELAATNLLQYLDEQAEATGAVPDDRTIVVERFRDEIGDWRVCVLSPFGAQVHAPWAMALAGPAGRALGRRGRADVERRRHRAAPARGGRRAAASTSWPSTPTRSTSSSSSPAAEHRDVRLALPGVRRPGPAAAPPPARPAHAAVAAAPEGGRPARRGRRSYPTFPILLEATRECVNDVFDLPALREVLRDLRGRKVRVVPVDTPRASPFAQSLLFGWIAVYMYEGDAPLAERRAAALALDRDLLRDLLGAEELRELLDPDVLADLELELQRLVDGRRARDADEVHDLLRLLGPLTASRARRPRRRRRADVAAWRRRPRRRAAGHPRLGGRRGARRRGRGRRPPARRPRRRAARSACRPRSPSRSTRRSTTSSPASPAPTGRSSPPRSPPRSASPPTGCGPCSTRSEADGRRRAGRVPARRRRARVVRRRRAAPAAAPVAGRAAQGGRAGRRRRPRPLPPRVAGRRLAAPRARRAGRGARPAPGRGAAGVGARDRHPARPARRATGPPTSTRCAPPARWCGSAPAASGPTDGRVRLAVPRPGRPAGPAPGDRRPAR